jgi:hypothetical protein
MSVVDKINLRWKEKQLGKYYDTCNGGSIRHQKGSKDK